MSILCRNSVCSLAGDSHKNYCGKISADKGQRRYCTIQIAHRKHMADYVAEEDKRKWKHLKNGGNFFGAEIIDSITSKSPREFKTFPMVVSWAEYIQIERSGVSVFLILSLNRSTISRSKKPVFRRANSGVFVFSVNVKFAIQAKSLPGLTISDVHAGKLTVITKRYTNLSEKLYFQICTILRYCDTYDLFFRFSIQIVL